MKLGDALVLAKTKVESVDQVRNLNLWGNGLTDVEVREARPSRPSSRSRSLFEFFAPRPSALPARRLTRVRPSRRARPPARCTHHNRSS